MSDNQREQSRDSDSAEPATKEVPSADARRAIRRRLVKAGLAALPAVLTLRSRPAWGQEPAPKPSGGVESGFYVSSGGTNPDPVSPEEQQLQQLDQSSGWNGTLDDPSTSDWWDDEPAEEPSDDTTW